MAAPLRPSIKIVKSFSWKGSAHLWSNRYCFGGTTPASPAAWTTMCDAVVLAEKAIYTPDITIVQAVGYDAGSDIPVFTKTYATVGTLAQSTNWLLPRECAAVVRYSTATRTSKNHPLYLFNYYHGVLSIGTGTPDTIRADQVTAYNTYGSAWVTGFSDGTGAKPRMGPNGNLATGVFTSTVITHRDFPRA